MPCRVEPLCQSTWRLGTAPNLTAETCSWMGNSLTEPLLQHQGTLNDEIEGLADELSGDWPSEPSKSLIIFVLVPDPTNARPDTPVVHETFDINADDERLQGVIELIECALNL